MMTILWIVSIKIKNVSIVDLFWGFGFVVTTVFYFINTDGNGLRKAIILIFTAIWGLRLSIYLTWRNYGKGEDFRYREFRKNTEIQDTGGFHSSRPFFYRVPLCG